MEQDDRTYKIIGAAMEVHTHMGPGFLEAVYQECLELEFGLRKISHESQPRLKIYYKEHLLNKFYVPDYLVNDAIVVEIKAEKCITTLHEAQILNSLKVCNKEIGLLINFGEKSLNYRRFINSHFISK